MLRKMKLKIVILFLTVIVAVSGCKKEWEDHYDVYPETVNQNVLEALQNDTQVSDFVQLLKDFQYDTLFQSDISYTVFAPTNEALQQFLSSNQVDTTLLKYHISAHFIQSGNIEGKRKIRTLSKKFALFEKYGNESKLDGILIDSESPLYKNGKYFIIDQVAEPRPNLYEFFAQNNQVLQEYIDSQDSIILDKERSKPIGFDDEGNTIYDTVSIVYNEFEEEYFPVSEEFRNKTATIVFPLKEDYEAALTVMAQNMGAGYTSHEDIPDVWQQEILVPFLLEKGVFENMLEPEEFVWKSPKDTLKLKNILGDSIQILYTPVEKSICSNGYAYNYQEFEVPDSLYNTASRFEAEVLLEETGVDRYAWGENVNVISDSPFQPYQEYIASASNDSIVRVLFQKGYSGSYSVEFNTQNLFPRKYVMVVRTHMDIGGIYDIYVNDELIRTFDYFDYVRYRGVLPSVTGDRFIPEGRFNRFDMYVDNITEFGKAKIKFEYKGPGNAPSNGLIIDYIDFVPANE
jgi:uncharacterized surface protein with fasciclin (FAS1) repeats